MHNVSNRKDDNDKGNKCGNITFDISDSNKANSQDNEKSNDNNIANVS